MKKTLLIITLLSIIFLPIINADFPEQLVITKNQINIQTKNNELFIEETFNILGKSDKTYDKIDIWINENAKDIETYFISDSIESTPLGNNYYRINISSYNINQNKSITLIMSYSINEDIDKFEKKISYDTNEININFNDISILNANNFQNKSFISISLYTPTEAPISTYLFIAIFLIVLLVLIIIYYLFRVRRSSKTKNILGESKELLSTKKTLIMSILKQLEKDYRAKKISDDTYHKLRDYYKQDAVDSMKKLEEIQSEII